MLRCYGDCFLVGRLRSVCHIDGTQWNMQVITAETIEKWPLKDVAYICTLQRPYGGDK